MHLSMAYLGEMLEKGGGFAAKIFPGMDAEIETLVRQCPECQEDWPGPPPSPLQPWQWPSRPWSPLHIDYSERFLGHMFLVFIDAHSKWIEVYPVRAATSNATIQQLRITFSQFGIPETVVSDNGQCFVFESQWDPTFEVCFLSSS